MGWRQDVFENEDIKLAYYATWGDELKVPDTIEEMVIISERLNGRHDYNNDGVDDWGFCLTPQTNYFQAFLAPIMQAHLHECEAIDGGFECMGKNTGQNIFFDIKNFDALIFNVSYSRINCVSPRIFVSVFHLIFQEAQPHCGSIPHTRPCSRTC